MKPNIPQKKFDEDAFIARMRRQHGDDWSTSVEANMEDAKESAQNRNDRAKKYQKRGEIYHHIIIPSCKYEGPQGYGDNNGVYSFRTKPIMGGSTKPPRTSTPNLPPALTAPPELTADVLGTGQPPTPAAPKPKRKSAARSGQPMKQNVTLVETWTQGEDSFGGAETKTGKTHKNLTQAQALKRIKDNPHKNYDIYVGGERVMLWSGAGRPFRVEYSPERKSKQTQAPKHKPAPAPNLPPILTAPPELTADVFGTGPMGLTPTPATPKARKPKTKVAAAPKAKPKATKPKAKKTAAAQKLTAAQREHLAIQGFVMVRRGGKYVKITG